MALLAYFAEEILNMAFEVFGLQPSLRKALLKAGNVEHAAFWSRRFWEIRADDEMLYGHVEIIYFLVHIFWCWLALSRLLYLRQHGAILLHVLVKYWKVIWCWNPGYLVLASTIEWMEDSVFYQMAQEGASLSRWLNTPAAVAMISIDRLRHRHIVDPFIILV